MSEPDFFLTDFEITETTEFYHAILGRALIIATRFDNLCDHTCILTRLKSGELSLCDLEDELNKYRNLASNISQLIPKKTLPELFNIFDKARVARNSIAHGLCKGLTGCIDSKITDLTLIEMVKDVVEPIAIADYWISSYISKINREPVLQTTSVTYSKRVLNWVLDYNSEYWIPSSPYRYHI